MSYYTKINFSVSWEKSTLQNLTFMESTWKYIFQICFKTVKDNAYNLIDYSIIIILSYELLRVSCLTIIIILIVNRFIK